MTPRPVVIVFRCFEATCCSHLQGFSWMFWHLFLLTSWSRVFLEKRIDFQPVKKFSAFYGTRRFITAFTSVSQLSLFWPKSIQSMLSIHVMKIHLNIIPHLCQGLPSGLFPSGFTHQNPVGTFPPPIRVTWSTHLILLDLITPIMSSKEYKSLS